MQSIVMWRCSQVSWCLLLMLVCVNPTKAYNSGPNICPVTGTTISLKEHEKVYFNSPNEHLRIKVTSDVCDFKAQYYFQNIRDILGEEVWESRIKSKDYSVYGNLGRIGKSYYSMQYRFDNKTFIMTIDGTNQVRRSRIWDNENCGPMKEFLFDFGHLTDLVLDEQLYGEKYKPDTFFSTYKNCQYKGTVAMNLIYVFIVIIIAVISIVIRYYLRKKMLQPVRVTVALPRAAEAGTLRNRSSRHTQEDFPPSYADIENQVAPSPPPTQPQSNQVLPDNGVTSTDAQNLSSETGDTESVSATTTNSSSILGRILTRNKQFSFKPLHEDQ